MKNRGKKGNFYGDFDNNIGHKKHSDILKIQYEMATKTTETSVQMLIFT